MPRITKVYTRTGDDGTTGLGDGSRVPKTDVRIQAYGTVDELNAALGVVLAGSLPAQIAEPLRRIQNELLHAGAELCLPAGSDRPGPRLEPQHTEALEKLLDEVTAQLPPLANFILPGGCPAAAQLHVARTIGRRAERDLLALSAREPVRPELLRYVNRLSDALFVLARYANHLAGVPEPLWDSRA